MHAPVSTHGWMQGKQLREEYDEEIEDNLESRMTSFKQLHPDINNQKLDALFHTAVRQVSSMVTQSKMKVNLDEPRFIEVTMALMDKLTQTYYATQQQKTALRPEMPMSQIMASKIEMANPFMKPKQEALSGIFQILYPLYKTQQML
ncbi:hypothetical protein BDQ17DRAFT_1327303 [Cyathus striatus]|nr:hypothetical protein BDQ17DRAFT_1327303 [Cyathus striatus]